MTRTPCCEKQGLKKGPWTPEEDEKLVKFISSHGEGNWSSVPKRAGLIRCGKSCRLRWANYLRPDLKRGLFSEEEERLILDLHKAIGNRWARIAIELPGRTDNDIKNYWNTRIKRKLRDMGIDPVTHKPLSQADVSCRSPKGSRRGPPPGEASRRYSRPSPSKSDQSPDAPRKLQPPRQTRPTSFALHAGDTNANSEEFSADEQAGDELTWANRRRSSRRQTRVDYGSGNEGESDNENEKDESVGDSSEEVEGSGSEASTEDSMDMGETPTSPTSVIRTAGGATLDERPRPVKLEVAPVPSIVRPASLAIPSEFPTGGNLLSPGLASPLLGFEASTLACPQDSSTAMTFEAVGCGILSPATLKSTMWDAIEPDWWEVTYADEPFGHSTRHEVPDLLMALSPADGACQAGALIGDLTSFDRPLSAGQPATRDMALLALVKQEPKEPWVSTNAEALPTTPVVDEQASKSVDYLWSLDDPVVPQLCEPHQQAAAQAGPATTLQQPTAPVTMCPLLTNTQNSWSDFFGATPKWSTLAPSHQDKIRSRDQLAGLVGLLNPGNGRWNASQMQLQSLVSGLAEC